MRKAQYVKGNECHERTVLVMWTRKAGCAYVCLRFVWCFSVVRVCVCVWRFHLNVKFLKRQKEGKTELNAAFPLHICAQHGILSIGSYWVNFVFLLVTAEQFYPLHREPESSFRHSEVHWKIKRWNPSHDQQKTTFYPDKKYERSEGENMEGSTTRSRDALLSIRILKFSYVKSPVPGP